MVENKNQVAKSLNRNMRLFLEKCIRNYVLGEYFRYCAELDLKNAKYIYKSEDKESFPLIIFLIQQSIEKYVKSYSLILGAINKKKLKGSKGIGHNTGKSFVFSLRQEELGTIISNLKELAPEIYMEETKNELLKINLDQSAKQLEDTIAYPHLRKYSIKKVLSKFKKMRLQMAKVIYSRNFQSDLFSSFKEGIRKLISLFYTSEKMEMEKHILAVKMDLIGFLMPLAFLTSFYEQETRYPGLSKNQKGPKDYMNLRTNIVKAIPEILNGLDKVNSDAKELYLPIKKLADLSKEKRKELMDKNLPQNDFKKEN